jgi:hypothetical protein
VSQRRDRQIVAPPRLRVEVTDRRRHPAVVQVGDRDREVAVLELGVLILKVFEPGLVERLGDRPGMPVPQIGEDAADRDAAMLAVPRTIEIQVAFDLLK